MASSAAMAGEIPCRRTRGGATALSSHARRGMVSWMRPRLCKVATSQSKISDTSSGDSALADATTSCWTGESRLPSWKLETVVPEAFRIAGRAQKGKLDMPLERAVRLACCDSFRKTGLLRRIIPGIEEVLAAGELPRLEPPPDAIGPAFEEEQSGDDGYDWL